MSDTIEDLLTETLELGEDAFAPMSEVLQLSTRWAAHEDTLGVLATLDGLADHEASRVRIVCLIAPLTMGDKALACDPEIVKRLTLRGLGDEAANVRLHAARLAGSVASPGDDIHLALKAMVATSPSPEPGSQDDKARARPAAALAAIDGRSGAA